PEDAAEIIDAGLVSAFDAGQRVAVLLSQSLIGRKQWIR
ncbi:phosphonopyruvate decarboxylase, partial [Ralstonia solanacearum]